MGIISSSEGVSMSAGDVSWDEVQDCVAGICHGLDALEEAQCIACREKWCQQKQGISRSKGSSMSADECSATVLMPWKKPIA
jgi:hypothetical protein